MPILYETGEAARAVFAGACVPEEADALLEWLRATPDAGVDLQRCETLHTALAQLLLAARARLLAPPPDPVLAECLRAAGCRVGEAADAAAAAGPGKPPRGGRRAGRGGTPAAAQHTSAGAP